VSWRKEVGGGGRSSIILFQWCVEIRRESKEEKEGRVKYKHPTVEDGAKRWWKKRARAPGQKAQKNIGCLGKIIRKFIPRQPPNGYFLKHGIC
jgi:hypothetical protein